MTLFCLTTWAALSAISTDAPSATSGWTIGMGLMFAVVPILIIAATSFLKISIVLAILRSALGAPGVPPTLVLTALAAVLTMFVMAPVGQEIVLALESSDLSQVLDNDPLGIQKTKQIFHIASPPLIDFLKANTSPDEISFFSDLANDDSPRDGFRILLPAFATGEVVEAFLMGFLLFVPFFVIDLIVGTVLLAIGMHMLSPTAISLPIKLLLFVVVDGWHIILSGLLVNYGS